MTGIDWFRDWQALQVIDLTSTYIGEICLLIRWSQVRSLHGLPINQGFAARRPLAFSSGVTPGLQTPYLQPLLGAKVDHVAFSNSDRRPSIRVDRLPGPGLNKTFGPDGSARLYTPGRRRHYVSYWRRRVHRDRIAACHAFRPGQVATGSPCLPNRSSNWKKGKSAMTAAACWKAAATTFAPEVAAIFAAAGESSTQWQL